MKNIMVVLIYVCSCGLYANNLDVSDSKDRSFWNKNFVPYYYEDYKSKNPVRPNYNDLVKICNTKEYFKEQGLQFHREGKNIILYTPMEQIELIIDNVILKGNKFIFVIADSTNTHTQDVYSLEFLDDTTIEWCMLEGCEKYVLCP